MKAQQALRSARLPLAVLASAVSLTAAGATLAALSDVEISAGQSVEAGMLAVEITGGQFTVPDLTPGQSGSRVLQAKNLGNVDGSLVLGLEVVVDAESEACTPSESEDPDEAPGGCQATGELDDVLLVTLTADSDGDGTFDQVVVGPGTASALDGLGSAGLPLPAGGELRIRLDYLFPDDVPHEEAMTDVLAFDVSAGLESQ